jgi:hypothetical protein
MRRREAAMARSETRPEKTLKNWRSVANKYQLPESEQELIAKVFERFL